MRELARKRMTVDEFLDWDDGTDTRYELEDGQPVAMATPIPEHGELVARITMQLASRTSAPCRVIAGVAVRHADHTWRSYVPDVLVTCEPREKGKKAIEAPVLIVEVASPSTAGHDREEKFDFYRAIESVAEILFVSAVARRIEVWRRQDGEWHAQLLGRGAVLRLGAIEGPIPIDEVYGDVLD